MPGWCSRLCLWRHTPWHSKLAKHGPRRPLTMFNLLHHHLPRLRLLKAPKRHSKHRNAPQPGQPGQWGPAGPPPDVQNGQIPPPPPTRVNSSQPQGSIRSTSQSIRGSCSSPFRPGNDSRGNSLTGAYQRAIGYQEGTAGRLLPGDDCPECLSRAGPSPFPGARR